MSEDRRRNNRHRKGGKGKARRHGGAPRATLVERHSKSDKLARQACRERFDAEPRPIAIPIEIEEPRQFSFVWENNPVDLKTESLLAAKVVRKGFGKHWYYSVYKINRCCPTSCFFIKLRSFFNKV